MTVEELIELTHNIQYKPGWRIFIEDRSTTYQPLFYLYVALDAPDSRDPKPGETMETAIDQLLMPEMIEEMAVEDVLIMIHKLIVRIEVHEAYEWFRYKGQQVWPPHQL